MKLFIALSFLALAVLYWVASGGAGFEPEPWPEPAAEADAPADPAGEVAAAPPPEAADPTTEAEAVAVAAPEGSPPEAAPSVAPPVAPPEGLPASPLGPDAALAALAPDLAPEAEAAPDAIAAGPLREVMGDRVNVRAGPGTGFDVVGQLGRGERAEVLDRRDGWALVRVGATEGWMSERFLAAP